MPHDRLRRNILHLCVVAASAMGLAGCDIVVNSMEGGHAKAQQEWSRTYTLAGADARVQVVNTNGNIYVEATDGAAVEVKATIETRGGTEDAAKEALKKVEIREETGGSQVRLETKYPREMGRSAPTVTYRLRVPRSAKVDVDTTNGTIHLTGVSSVKAGSTNGNVEGKGISGSVVAETTNGSIKLEMAELGADGVSAETTNGMIDLKLPKDAKATVAARCVNGGISVNELSFERSGEASRRKLDGTINGGGAALNLNTTNGGIRIGRLE